MNNTDSYVLGSILMADNAAEKWTEFRSLIPHPLIFSSIEAQSYAVVLDMAASQGRYIGPKGLTQFLSEIPYWSFRERFRELNKIIGREYQIDRRLVNSLVAANHELEVGDKDLTLDDTLLDHLGGYSGYIELTSKGFPGVPIENLADMALRVYGRREMTALLERSKEALADENYNLSEIMARLAKASQRLSVNKGIEADIAEAFEAGEEIPEEDRGETPLWWGDPWINKNVDTPPGSLVIISAPQKQGKTAFEWQIATETARNAEAKSRYYSFEMGKNEYWQRVKSRMLAVPLNDVKRNKFRQYEVELLQGLKIDLADKLTMLDQRVGKVTVEWLEADILQATRKDPEVKYIFIDHLHLIKWSLRGNVSPSDQIAHITSTLKALAGRLGIVIVMAAQLKREGRAEHRDREGKITAIPELRISDILGGSSIESDASHILLLWPETPEDQEKENRIFRIKLAACRHGKPWTKRGYFNAEIQTIGVDR